LTFLELVTSYRISFETLRDCGRLFVHSECTEGGFSLRAFSLFFCNW